MTRRTALTAAAVVAVAAVAATITAYADSPVPQAGSPCWPAEAGGALDGAQTVTPQGVLVCRKIDQASQWQRQDRLQLPVETFFTYGPPATLAAADILPATSWVSSPVSGAACTAVQTPATGAPVTHTNNGPYFRDFLLVPDLASLTLSGHCNWRKAWQRAPG